MHSKKIKVMVIRHRKEMAHHRKERNLKEKEKKKEEEKNVQML